MVTTDALQAYDRSRAPGTDLSVLCHAPFVSLNFDQSGRVTACCYNREYVLGRYPAQSVQEIWTGPAAQALREAFLRGAVVRGCDGCFDQVRLGNFAGALMRNFDGFSIGRPPRRDSRVNLPLVLEFEIANTCSLACVMCGGHWSSTIRERREGLAPVRSPYDRAFVEQIEALLPAVSVARFLGGEPFLIPRYHEIWTSMRRLSPDAELSITTSAAVVPERPRRLLDELRAHIVVSLDAITEATYEAIRVHARFADVMANLDDFLTYTRRQDTTLTVACCPMTHNWHELPALVEFCERRGIRLFFNTVTAPVESSLACLPEGRLAAVVAFLDEHGTPRADDWSHQSREQWLGLMNLLRGWLKAKRALGWVRPEQAILYASASDEPAMGSGPAPPALRERVAVIRGAISGRLARLPSEYSNVAHRIRDYAECLLTEWTSAEWQQAENGTPASYDALGRVADEADLEPAVQAVRMFTDVVRPDDLPRLAARWQAFHSRVGGRPAAVLRDVYQIHWLMVRLPDEAFMEQIADLGGR